jgi:hypothetical protein
MMTAMMIPKSKVREFQSDLKRWHIKHHPFIKMTNGEYCIRIFEHPYADLLLIKYG